MRCRIQLILLAATADSFFLQLKEVASNPNFSGVSPSYILFNLFAATAHFALCLHLTVVHEHAEDILVNSPPKLEDYLNLAQFGFSWISYLWLFILYIRSSDSLTHQVVNTCIYIILCLVAFIPICIEGFLPPSRGDYFHDRSFFSALYTWVLTQIIIPVATLSIGLSLLPEAMVILSSPEDSPPALSPRALAYQAWVFLGVAIAWQVWWMFEGLTPRHFRAWYSLTGWAVLNAVLYAFVQAILSLLVLWHGYPDVGDDAERARDL